MERGLLFGIVALRWAAWVWMAAVTLANLHRVHHPVLAAVVVAVTGVVTAAAHFGARGDKWQTALQPARVAGEFVVAVGVVAVDG